MHLYKCSQKLGAYDHIRLRDQAFDLGQDPSRAFLHGSLALGLGYGLLSQPPPLYPWLGFNLAWG